MYKDTSGLLKIRVNKEERIQIKAPKNNIDLKPALTLSCLLAPIF